MDQVKKKSRMEALNEALRLDTALETLNAAKEWSSSYTDVVRDSAHRLFDAGAGIFNKGGSLSGNDNARKGFVAEGWGEATINLDARWQGIPIQFQRIPPNQHNTFNERFDGELGEAKFAPDLVATDQATGEILFRAQFKFGQPAYVKQAAESPEYAQRSDQLVTNADNQHIADEYPHVSTKLEFRGASSIPLSDEAAQWIADHPNEVQDYVQKGTDAVDNAAGAAGAAAGIIGYAVLMESLVFLGQSLKNGSMSLEQARSALQRTFDSIKAGVTTFTLVKAVEFCIDYITDAGVGSFAPAILVRGAIQHRKAFIAWAKKEKDFSELYREVGPQLLILVGIMLLVHLWAPTKKLLFVSSIFQRVLGEEAAAWLKGFKEASSAQVMPDTNNADK